MADMFDYLHWRGDLSFQQAPFCPVDGVILARLAYLPFGCVLPEPSASCRLGDAARVLLSLSDRQIHENDAQLLRLLPDNPRFADLTILGFTDRLNEQTQFSALTAVLTEAEAYLSFRGTDNTLVGWKEDFNMAFVCPVPAQRLAVRYLERISASLPGALRLGGHSKGGNLAVYAAAFCEAATQARVVGVYNFDGPGFDEQVLQSPNYQRIFRKVQTYVPQSSVVGMLLGHEEQYSIVSSSQIGLWQHNLYSWDVLRTGFVQLDQVTDSSRFMDYTLKAWLKDMAPEQRETFIDTIYTILIQTNARTLREMGDNWFQNAVVMARSVKNLDEHTRKAVTHALGLLFKCAKSGLVQVMQQRGRAEKEA